MKRILMAVAILGLFLSSVYAAQTKTPPAGKKEYVLKGKVEKVDPAGKTLTVNNENVEGWMGKMTMSYAPDKEDVLKKLKPGDQITAKVYDGDFRTLYNIQVVDSKPAETKGAAPAAKKDGKASKAPAKK